MPMKIRKELRIDEYTDEMLIELKHSGKFGSEGAIIRLAVQEFYRAQSPKIAAKLSQTPRLVVQPSQATNSLQDLAHMFGAVPDY